MQDVDQDPSEKGLAFSGLATMEPMEPTLWSFPYGAYGGPHGVYGPLFEASSWYPRAGHVSIDNDSFVVSPRALNRSLLVRLSFWFNV